MFLFAVYSLNMWFKSGSEICAAKSALVLALGVQESWPIGDQFPFRSALPIQVMKIHSANSSGGNNTSLAGTFHILNLQDDYSVYMASPN
jgi:hypothetical protein